MSFQHQFLGAFLKGKLSVSLQEFMNSFQKTVSWMCPWFAVTLTDYNPPSLSRGVSKWFEEMARHRRQALCANEECSRLSMFRKVSHLLVQGQGLSVEPTACRFETTSRQKGVGIAQWTCDWKVMVWIPAGAAGEFSSPGSTFCADSYFGIRSTPVLPQ